MSFEYRFTIRTPVYNPEKKEPEGLNDDPFIKKLMESSSMFHEGVIEGCDVMYNVQIANPVSDLNAEYMNFIVKSEVELKDLSNDVFNGKLKISPVDIPNLLEMKVYLEQIEESNINITTEEKKDDNTNNFTQMIANDIISVSNEMETDDNIFGDLVNVGKKIK